MNITQIIVNTMGGISDRMVHAIDTENVDEFDAAYAEQDDVSINDIFSRLPGREHTFVAHVIEKISHHESFKDSYVELFMNGPVEVIDAIRKHVKESLTGKGFEAACACGNITIVKHLDDIMAKNAMLSGLAAAHYEQQQEIVDLILDKGVTINDTDIATCEPHNITSLIQFTSINPTNAVSRLWSYVEADTSDDMSFLLADLIDYLATSHHENINVDVLRMILPSKHEHVISAIRIYLEEKQLQL